MLVMDTARFKHPPQWIPVETLWEAMKRVDAETGRPRGFMVLEKAHNLSHRLFTAKSTNYKDWPQVCMNRLQSRLVDLLWEAFKFAEFAVFVSTVPLSFYSSPQIATTLAF